MVFLLIEVRTAESSYLNYCDICQHQSRVIKQVQISLSKFGWLGGKYQGYVYVLLHFVFKTYQTKTTKLNLPNQAHQTKHTKSTKINLSNQTYQNKLNQTKLTKLIETDLPN